MKQVFERSLFLLVQRHLIQRDRELYVFDCLSVVCPECVTWPLYISIVSPLKWRKCLPEDPTSQKSTLESVETLSIVISAGPGTQWAEATSFPYVILCFPFPELCPIEVVKFSIIAPRWCHWFTEIRSMFMSFKSVESSCGNCSIVASDQL